MTAQVPFRQHTRRPFATESPPHQWFSDRNEKAQYLESSRNFNARSDVVPSSGLIHSVVHSAGRYIIGLEAYVLIIRYIYPPDRPLWAACGQHLVPEPARCGWQLVPGSFRSCRDHSCLCYMLSGVRIAVPQRCGASSELHEGTTSQVAPPTSERLFELVYRI